LNFQEPSALAPKFQAYRFGPFCFSLNH